VQYEGCQNPMKLAAVLLIAGVGLLQAQEITHTTPLRVIRTVEAKYTKEALDAKLEGVVILSAVVGVNGIASDIQLVRGLGKGLDEKAIEALRQWRFSPATKYGEPVSTKAQFEIDFRLSNPLQNPINPK
jgi:TonB family protein